MELKLTQHSCKSQLYIPNVFEPSKLLLLTDLLESCLHQLYRSHNLAQLHQPLNNFFQCFQRAPKLLSTLRLGEVSVWAKNLSMMYKWGGWSRGKPRENVQMIIGMTISNSQVFCQGFFSEKYSLHFVGNEGIYSIGKEFGKVLFHFAKQRVSWVPHKMAFLTKYQQTGQAGMTLQLLVMCFTRGLLTGCFTCELLAGQS